MQPKFAYDFLLIQFALHCEIEINFVCWPITHINYLERLKNEHIFMIHVNLKCMKRLNSAQKNWIMEKEKLKHTHTHTYTRRTNQEKNYENEFSNEIHLSWDFRCSCVLFFQNFYVSFKRNICVYTLYIFVCVRVRRK